MSYLNDKMIKALAEREGLIDPFDPAKLNPCSYDLSLGEDFLDIRDFSKPFAPHNIDEARVYNRHSWDGMMDLLPGRFVLATTRERVKIPDNMAAQVLGKSSVGRMGLFIQNAGHIDPGFEGQITLELFNAGGMVLRLSDFDRIAQIVFIPLVDSCETPYNGKYQNQSGVTAPKAYEDVLPGQIRMAFSEGPYNYENIYAKGDEEC